MIPPDKSCIFLDGSGFRVTEIQWNDHATTATSPTFTSYAQNLVVQGITFRNTYNALGSVTRREDIKPAIAALIQGDKAIFHKCGFIGLQDTLWDGPGRHLFTQCYIEGVIDVISGFGQSIYKECVINIPINAYAPLLNEGFITAQGKENPSESSGFVFIRCIVKGSGKVFLGRAYRPFSTVIFHLCFLPSCIDPAGWNSWQQVGHESNLTYSETRCIGPGADTSSRVPWLKRLDVYQIRRFTDISYIDPQGYWTSRLPVLS
ncbi:putative pectinesterase 52 [Cucumis melo]|uniref:pectinesterase n=1 Tax=Cucumis melo TaxID=3656 RepID=A0ABM3KNE9_CUCME|nr:putative pectinesterase 52 [Cucumis melo]